ncbi:MAG: hypothetical protein ACM31L_06845 [Actinomycetota bacterium]
MRTLLAAAAVLLLAGCNADERGHVVKLGKGGYAGPADTEIGEATRQALASRVTLQAGGPVGLAQALAPSEPPAGGAAPIDGRMAGQNY